jgi:hypothetical protein
MKKVSHQFIDPLQRKEIEVTVCTTIQTMYCFLFISFVFLLIKHLKFFFNISQRLEIFLNFISSKEINATNVSLLRHFLEFKLSYLSILIE